MMGIAPPENAQEEFLPASRSAALLRFLGYAFFLFGPQR